MNVKSKDVTVIICVRNGENTIKDCIESIILNKPFEIIVVDGNSNDRTIEICAKYEVKILKDEGIGLGNARNLGLKHVTSEYVYYVGPDNILEKNSIDSLVRYAEEKKWIGVSPLVEIHKSNCSYIGKSLNIYRRAKLYEGQRDIIGTPWLYKSSVLKNYYFNDKMNYSDDTELCSRLSKSNYKIGISNVLSYELGEDNFRELGLRWINYGNSDSEFYQKFKNEWGVYRKLISILSPLKKDFIKIIFSYRIYFYEKIYILPFLLFIIVIRYQGWINAKQRF